MRIGTTMTLISTLVTRLNPVNEASSCSLRAQSRSYEPHPRAKAAVCRGHLLRAVKRIGGRTVSGDQGPAGSVDWGWAVRTLKWMDRQNDK